jgi:superfamily II DNA helicase RecQ
METDLEDYAQDLYDRLDSWCTGVARQAGQRKYLVFPIATLKRIAAQKPKTPEELLAVKGVGPRKLEQYGPAVLAIVVGQEPDPPAHDSSP